MALVTTRPTSQQGSEVTLLPHGQNREEVGREPRGEERLTDDRHSERFSDGRREEEAGAPEAGKSEDRITTGGTDEGH